MKKYTIKNNSRYAKDFFDMKPWIFCYPKIKDKILTVEAKFDETALFPHNNDIDLKKDWNKLWGLSLRLWPSNKDYLTVGWSPSEDELGYIEILPYANISGKEKKFYTGRKLLVKPKEQFQYKIYPISKREWIIQIISEWGISYEKFEFDRKPILLRRTRLYFGGTDKSNQEIDFYMDSYIN